MNSVNHSGGLLIGEKGNTNPVIVTACVYFSSTVYILTTTHQKVITQPIWVQYFSQNLLENEEFLKELRKNLGRIGLYYYQQFWKFWASFKIPTKYPNKEMPTLVSKMFRKYKNNYEYGGGLAPFLRSWWLLLLS